MVQCHLPTETCLTLLQTENSDLWGWRKFHLWHQRALLPLAVRFTLYSSVQLMIGFWTLQNAREKFRRSSTLPTMQFCFLTLNFSSAGYRISCCDIKRHERVNFKVCKSICACVTDTEASGVLRCVGSYDAEPCTLSELRLNIPGKRQTIWKLFPFRTDVQMVIQPTVSWSDIYTAVCLTYKQMANVYLNYNNIPGEWQRANESVQTNNSHRLSHVYSECVENLMLLITDYFVTLKTVCTSNNLVTVKFCYVKW